jgi:predicted Rdx family selenoprotein
MPKINLGGQGQLDVIVNGTVVFSRKEAGRYPTADEIVQTVEGGSTVPGLRNIES